LASDAQVAEQVGAVTTTIGATLSLSQVQGRLVLVTEAVCALTRRGATATVNTIAHEIGIDQSGASRLVSAAADAGYVEVNTPTTDSRRREVTVTASGLAMLDHAHDWQEAVFAHLTEGWSNRQRRDFQDAMLSLLERSRTVTA
jgi:MarR family transcriptional regulator, organic hydroperoxide resistance regulator